MIKIKTPSLALHSHDVPGYKYKMWKTVHLPASATAIDVIREIKTAAQQSANGFLENVVINCHGYPGGLKIGANNYMGIESTYLFSDLSNPQLVGTIWLVACEVAKTEGNSIGKDFCSDLSYWSGAEVVAGKKKQRVNLGFYLRGVPDNAIDRYEGMVYKFSPDHDYEVWQPPFN